MPEATGFSIIDIYVCVCVNIYTSATFVVCRDSCIRFYPQRERGTRSGGVEGKIVERGGAAVQGSPTNNFQSKAILIVFIENNCT